MRGCALSWSGDRDLPLSPSIRLATAVGVPSSRGTVQTGAHSSVVAYSLGGQGPRRVD